VLEQLAALARIAEIDAEALRSDTELKDASALLAAQEDELQNQNQALARSKAKSARARNMREADAVERELEVIRRSMKDREEERQTLKAAIDKRNEKMGKHETELAELRKFAEEERQKADTRTAELQQVREKVMAGRRELAAKIPADVLRRYEMIRDKRQAGAVAIKNGICLGCNTSVRPNQAIAVLRGETFEQCPRCQRLLFSPEAIKGYEQSKTEAVE